MFHWVTRYQLRSWMTALAVVLSVFVLSNEALARRCRGGCGYSRGGCTGCPTFNGCSGGCSRGGCSGGGRVNGGCGSGGCGSGGCGSGGCTVPGQQSGQQPVPMGTTPIFDQALQRGVTPSHASGMPPQPIPVSNQAGPTHAVASAPSQSQGQVVACNTNWNGIAVPTCLSISGQTFPVLVQRATGALMVALPGGVQPLASNLASGLVQTYQQNHVVHELMNAIVSANSGQRNIASQQQPGVPQPSVPQPGLPQPGQPNPGTGVPNPAVPSRPVARPEPRGHRERKAEFVRRNLATPTLVGLKAELERLYATYGLTQASVMVGGNHCGGCMQEKRHILSGNMRMPDVILYREDDYRNQDPNLLQALRINSFPANLTLRRQPDGQWTM